MLDVQLTGVLRDIIICERVPTSMCFLTKANVTCFWANSRWRFELIIKLKTCSIVVFLISRQCSKMLSTEKK